MNESAQFAVPEAVIFSGGAAWAAYEVGVLLSLVAGRCPSTGFRPLRPLVYTGTSAGSFNAAALVSAPSPDPIQAGRLLEQIWLRDIAEQVDGCSGGAFRIRGLPSAACVQHHPRRAAAEAVEDTLVFARAITQRAAHLVTSDAPIGRRLMDVATLSLFISPEPLRQLVRKYVVPTRIRASNLRLRVAATDWRNGDLRLFSNQDFNDDDGIDIVVASSAIPGIYPPVDLGGELFVDGGIFMNTPLRAAVHAGAEVLHVIFLEPDASHTFDTDEHSTAQLLLRSLAIANAANIRGDLDTAMRVNEGLKVIDKVSRRQTPTDKEVNGFVHAAAFLAAMAANPGTNSIEMEDFTRAARHVAARISVTKHYRPICVHLYHPRDLLGGPYGMANFNLDFIRQLIEQGYADGRRHDCRAAGCLIPN